jgi:hypothetical protein
MHFSAINLFFVLKSIFFSAYDKWRNTLERYYEISEIPVFAKEAFPTFRDEPVNSSSRGLVWSEISFWARKGMFQP